jgi:Zn-dependent protease
MAASVDLPRIIAEVAIFAVPILAAIVFHEVAHGLVAYLCGDPTAARHGRLTLNPLPHIDPFGTILLPGLLLLGARILGTTPFVFGYARPAPVDPRRFRHPRRDSILVALAGPATNFLLAAASALVLAWLPAAPEPASLVRGLRQMALASLGINCLLGVFNLLPLPPLDGGRVLMALLPPRSLRVLRWLDGLGYAVVLLVIVNTDVVRTLVRPVMGFFLGIARLGR